MHKPLFFISLLLVTLHFFAGTGLAATAEKMTRILCDRLELCRADFSNPRTDNDESRTLQRRLCVIYDQTGGQPLWVTADGPGEQAAILLSVLKNSELDGLIPEHYHVSRLASLWNGRTPEELAELDTLLTLAFITYAHDAQYGRANFRKASPDLRAKGEASPVFDAPALIQRALSSPDLNQFLAGLLPQHIYYKNLRAALPRYRDLAAAGTWPTVAPGKSIHPGEEDGRIPLIRQRLAAEGFLESASTTDTPVYDDSLVEAVTLFQVRHGLSADGVIGKSTINAMNIPVEKKLRKIVINLERWRGEAHDLGKKYALVDIAGFTLEGVIDNALILEMPVVVGTQHHETPVFSDRIQYIELNPYWNIPTKIARDEMLEELRKNPHYLSSNRIRLFSDWTPEAREINPMPIDWKQVSPKQMGQFKLRQDPGKRNALGAIKFVFPNSYSVYMHDTPAQADFKRSIRAFSHGCIRLGNPLKLADFLLGGIDNGWPPARFNDIITTGKRTIVRLPEPLPVHITYHTVKSDRNGAIFFYTDIYNRDQLFEDILLRE